ncbi:MAG: WHG domain-containing protein [Erythrobacter sp.]|uniref:TetR-like C-terminal domain-containing protein n=1 Tax=Erythrobacter sp. TaxID=1042 RepID=UPI0025F94E90|nr:TetR-like C-terminal domain-containing protein [Erythrobacter sp.]MCM0000402.1 WHG domain-containing protein [Erythrobacter sp.]
MTRRAAYHHGDLAAAALDAAEGLVVEDPSASFSLRLLAERLGVAHRALYNHFADRDALLAALAARGFARLADALAPAPDPAGFMAAYIGFALAQPGLYAVMMGRHHDQINAHPPLRAAVDRVIAAALDALATPGADEETRRRKVMRVWMLAHGAIGLQRAGMLRMRSDAAFVDEVLHIAGLAPPQEKK